MSKQQPKKGVTTSSDTSDLVTLQRILKSQNVLLLQLQMEQNRTRERLLYQIGKLNHERMMTQQWLTMMSSQHMNNNNSNHV